MESGADTTPDTASQFLHRHAEVRSRVQKRGPSRGDSWLALAGGAVFSLYAGVFLFTAPELDASSAGPGAVTTLMLLPVLLFSALASGARDRFSIRTQPSAGHRVGYVVATAGFVLLAALSVVGIHYAWGWNLVVPIALFAAMGATPFRRLATGRVEPGSWVNRPLSGMTRWTTVSIGVVIGVLAGTSALPGFPVVSAVILMVTLTASLIGWRSAWGLPSTGFAWGPLHWIGFVGAALATLALATVLATTEIVTPLVSMLVGAAVCAVMVVTAFFPHRPRQG